jgi:spore maturation protein CgeB
MGKFDAIEPCHLYLVKDTYVTGLLHRAGLHNVHYLPQCTNHHVYKPMDIPESDASLFIADIALIGSMYPYRRRFMEEIADMQPVIWGRGWKRTKNVQLRENYRGRDIRGTEKTLAMNGAAININLHHPLNDILGTSSRTFDISACRSFQLADYKSDMEDLLKVGEEIICFKNADEFRKLARYYLDHPDERAEIAGRAYDRTLKEHTYERRAATVLELIKSV